DPATRGPTPPPKDTPPPPQEEVSVLDDHDGIDVDAYFHRRQFSRANSIYTISRASFTNQIHQLTSISLPPAASLSSSIKNIPTSTAAGRALHEAANQIKLWMAKASEVLSGLDAEDDVEWAAAAGREGLAEVDAAIGKFEELVEVYITAIEDLQSRSDIGSLPARDQQRLVGQMEEVMGSWAKIKKTLKGIKAQVEIAMEWEELWNVVLGEIGFEIENLSRLVFEMEERRHRAITDSVAESAEKFDIAELETIVEETPRQQARQNNRFSLPPPLAVLSPISPIPQIEQENSRLLALFAKLQPLRASLDFLPMRLSSFQMRANIIFPSACDELMRRKEILQQQEEKLEGDADALRQELGEDKWVHSFRQAGSKAIAMYDSLMKSIQRLRQAIDDNDEDKVGSRISTYKDKRAHYPASIRRVLELIDIEMKHRSTVNGEILRIQEDVRSKVADLTQQIQDMNAVLDEFTATRKLRDSVSTVLSSRTEVSLAGSAIDTPGSSPASSIIMSRKSSEYVTPAGKKSRQASASSSRASLPNTRRYSSLPVSNPQSAPRKSMTTSRIETVQKSVTPSRAMSSTPSYPFRSSTPGSDSASANKPRWNASTNMRDTVVGHNYKPLSLTTPSPYAKGGSPARSLRSVSSHSSIPVRSPLSRTSVISPPPATRPASTTPAQQTSRRPGASTIQSPSTPARGKAPMRGTPGSSQFSTGTPASGRRLMNAEEEGDNTANEDSPIVRRQSRPASAMTNRRVSLLPTPKQRTASGSSVASLGGTPGRSPSRLGSIDEGRKSRISMDATRSTSRTSGRKSALGTAQTPDDKPKWR
ncbi:karyogamy protein, partial [Amniculicola lignicola CBS 123094]